MDDFMAARMQMAMSLGFHILFAVAGMAMPLLMVLAEGKWLRSKDPVYLDLAKRWSKGVAILFAVGAVSGTALSFELGLLWPQFMEFAGPVFGLAFTLEGFAFFFEAIFLGVYLYGWDRISPRAHWLSGLGVLISGSLSGMFVVTANAWMNNPTGFDIGPEGLPINIRPLEAILNPNALPEAFHMLTASFAAMGFAVMAVHAFYLLRDPANEFHKKGLSLALLVGFVGAAFQPITGHVAGETIAVEQPLKLAAAEGHWETSAQAPFLIGGWADEEAEETYGALEIPYLLSVLAHRDPNAVVEGIKETPREDRPPVAVVHLAFDTMVGCGMIMLAVGGAGLLLWWRGKQIPTHRWWLRAAVLSGPLGMLAVEAGWTVTEVGRQPWIIYKVMRTTDAITPATGLVSVFITFSLLYLTLGILTILLLRRQFRRAPVSTPVEVEHA